MVYIETCMNILNVDFFLKNKENLSLKSQLSHAATITKQINAIQEGIALNRRRDPGKMKGSSRSRQVPWVPWNPPFTQEHTGDQLTKLATQLE